MKHKTKASTPPKSILHSGTEKSVSRSSSPLLLDDSIDLKDIPLRLPEISELDHGKSFPTISSLIQSNDVTLSLEELNSLQAELEGLLASTASRKKFLTDEKEIVDNIEKYKGQTKLFRKQPGSPKRFPVGEIRNSKKLKLSASKQSDIRISGGIRVKSEQDVENDNDKKLFPESSIGFVYKNETAEKFWSFVKPYSSPITISHIEMIKGLIASHSETSDLLKVPKLGIHYSKRSPDDQENDRYRGIISVHGTNLSLDPSQGSGPNKPLSNAPEESPFGDCTQRLISALLEDDTMGPPEESLERGKKSSESDSTDYRFDFIKSLDIRNAQALEARILNELKEIGVLDSNDDDEENDEVLAELKKCQEEFKIVAERHTPILNSLLSVATTELLRQQLRDRLQAADREVMETFQKIGVSRSKRGSLSKKEREQAWKVLRERDIIQKQLDGV